MTRLKRFIQDPGQIGASLRRRRLRRQRVEPISRYMTAHDSRGLQLGAGGNPLDGWLNTDLIPGGDCVYLDVCERFPFDDRAFDRIFTEHMIEHIPLFRGRQMLSECFRVLKPGGTIRIATPDFRSLVDLYLQPDEPLHRRYLDWATQTHGDPDYGAAPIFVINNFVRAWSHSFIYDEHALTTVLGLCGFVNARRCAVGESEVAQMSGLEHHHRVIGEDFNRFETMIIEADRPDDAAGAAGGRDG